MYRPDHFRVDDLEAMHALMRARPLATLVSSSAAGLCATHMPTVLKDEGANGTISGAYGLLAHVPANLVFATLAVSGSAAICLRVAWLRYGRTATRTVPVAAHSRQATELISV